MATSRPFYRFANNRGHLSRHSYSLCLDPLRDSRDGYSGGEGAQRASHFKTPTAAVSSPYVSSRSHGQCHRFCLAPCRRKLRKKRKKSDGGERCGNHAAAFFCFFLCLMVLS
ncbi:hypothetical protein L596_023467 [Steinernema carpocapsae]|uniref:Uncharacterized protein n=1 Tax=Steinernema carpocapsae TaxID=34508 RepID=A0A4U5MDS6_STECR|nr:hypothetical protein L596_023467 [Steinernema carpocapsae]